MHHQPWQQAKKCFVISALCMTFFYSTYSHAESDLEPKYQDMFVTAGYSAAAGAAVGAALLTLQEEPTKNLKFISIGASLGFISGAAVGSWLAFAPMFVDSHHRPEPTALSSNIGKSKNPVVIRPWINIDDHHISGLEAGTVLASF